MAQTNEIALFIDDEEVARAAAEPLLRAAGYDVLAAESGAEGLALLAKGLRPAVILVDLFMPKLDAVGFRRKQVAEPAWAAIPTIIMATTTFKGFKTDAMGMPLLRKPFGARELAEALEAVRQGPRQGLASARR